MAKVVLYSLLALFLLLCVVVLVFWTGRDRAVLLSGYQHFDFGGLQRSYLISKPSQPVKNIVIGLHGFSDSARRFAYYTGLHNAVDDSTLVVYPLASEPTKKGTLRGWNAGFCCGSGYLNSVDDVSFIIALSEHLKSRYNAADAKVYATGFSNGGFMAQKLGAERPDYFSAIAAVAGTIGTTSKQITPTSPIPILIIQGRQDRTIPFDGGTGASDPDFSWLPYSQTLSTWQAVNGNATPTETIVHDQDGHKWHGWRIANVWHKKPQASLDIVNFFYQEKYVP